MRRSGSALAAAIAVAFGPAASAGPAPPAPPSGAALAALSAPASPTSLASQRVYFVMPDRYANGDPANDEGGRSGSRNVTGFDSTDTAYYHGGDLKGLTGNLKRIKDLGFTALWVTPVLKQDPYENGSAAYHGYWGLDFTTVDPHLGTDRDFADLVTAAHRLGLKVYLDVVVNHTADVVQLANGGSYSDIPFRDCRGRFFRADRYVTARRFPCLAARYMPQLPYVPPADRDRKRPAWLNDPLNYHDRGNIDFGSCSLQCFEQGDFYGLDDLFTEKPRVVNGLAQIYASWITRFHVDGFRVDTARHVNAAFFRLWVPKVLAAARAAGIPDFQIFGEVFLGNATDLVPFVRARGLPNILDFPFQEAAAGFAAGSSSALAVGNRLQDDDYFRLPDGRDPAPPTFLGNHDMGRAALQIAQRGIGLSGEPLLERVLLGYDLLYLLRGAPVVYYGDEVGMIGTGGDQQARQDMFPTRVAEWKTQTRLGGTTIGDGSSLDVTGNPIETRLRELAKLRDEYPELATGATVIRYSKGKVLAVSRIDAAGRRELVVAFNAGDTATRVTVSTATRGGWEALFGASAGIPAQASPQIPLEIPPRGAVVYRSTAEIDTSRFVPKATLTVTGDDLTSYLRATATVSAGPPVTVIFAVRPQGAGSWRRLAADDSPPYRAFIDPARYPRGRQVSIVAIVRTLDGKTFPASKVVTVTPRR